MTSYVFKDESSSFPFNSYLFHILVQYLFWNKCMSGTELKLFNIKNLQIKWKRGYNSTKPQTCMSIFPLLQWTHVKQGPWSCCRSLLIHVRFHWSSSHQAIVASFTFLRTHALQLQRYLCLCNKWWANW